MLSLSWGESEISLHCKRPQQRVLSAALAEADVEHRAFFHLLCNLQSAVSFLVKAQMSPPECWRQFQLTTRSVGWAPEPDVWGGRAGAWGCSELLAALASLGDGNLRPRGASGGLGLLHTASSLQPFALRSHRLRVQHVGCCSCRAALTATWRYFTLKLGCFRREREGEKGHTWKLILRTRLTAFCHCCFLLVWKAEGLLQPQHTAI